MKTPTFSVGPIPAGLDASDQIQAWNLSKEVVGQGGMVSLLDPIGRLVDPAYRAMVGYHGLRFCPQVKKESAIETGIYLEGLNRLAVDFHPPWFVQAVEVDPFFMEAYGSTIVAGARAIKRWSPSTKCMVSVNAYQAITRDWDIRDFHKPGLDAVGLSFYPQEFNVPASRIRPTLTALLNKLAKHNIPAYVTEYGRATEHEPKPTEKEGSDDLFVLRRLPVVHVHNTFVVDSPAYATVVGHPIWGSMGLHRTDGTIKHAGVTAKQWSSNAN